MGPQSFRAVCLAMCGNSSILSLSLADNMADTDSAVSNDNVIEKSIISESCNLTCFVISHKYKFKYNGFNSFL